MLPVVLLILTFLSVFEGTLTTLTITSIALAASLYSIKGGEQSWGYVRAAAVKYGKRIPIGFRRNDTQALWIGDRFVVEAIVFLHVVATPPWFFLSPGDFFYPGLCGIAILAGILRFANDRIGRIAEAD